MKLRTEIVTADWHIPFHDEIVEAIFFQVLKHNRYDVCRLLGDLCDCFAISKFSKDTKRDKEADTEFAQLVNFLERIQKTNPRMRILWHEGNHEHRFDKLQDRDFGMGRFLGKQTLYAAVMTLRDEEGVGIGKRKINLKYEPAKPGVYLAPDFFLAHGDPRMDGVSQSVWSGYSEKLTMDRRMSSGMMAHGHKIGMHWRDNKCIQSLGCACQLDQGYNPGRGWQHALGFIVQDGKWIDSWVRPIVGQRLVLDGYVYTWNGRSKI